MSNDSDSFIQEVEEGVRQDKAMAALKRWGPWFGALAVLALIGVGGWQIYDAVSRDAAHKASDVYQSAQDQRRDGDVDAALATFERMSSEGPAIYRAMAMMERASILAERGDLDAALAAFDQAAETAKDPLLRDTARFRAALIVAERQDFQAARSRLQPIIDAGTPISLLAREALGVEAWEAGDLALARDMLENLTLSLDAPESLRQRAEIALSVIGPVETPPAETQPAPSPAAQTPAPGAAPAPAPTSGDNE